MQLADLMRDARAGYKGSEAEKKFVDNEKFDESVRVFFRERLEFYLKDVRGYAYDVVKAVLAADADEVVDALARTEALARVRESDDFQCIAIAAKRMKNILRQARAAGYEVPPEFHEAVLQSDAERELFTAAQQIGRQFRTFRLERKYDAALAEMAKLRVPIDRFFEKFMVLDENPVVRSYRLAFLQNFLSSSSTIADFSEIVADGSE